MPVPGATGLPAQAVPGAGGLRAGVDGRDLLDALLAPRSIALVGASNDRLRPPGRPLWFLRRDGWPGRVYPVNPRRSSVLGERAWPSLDALPEVPDHVLVLSPTETVVGVVEACGRLGVPVATVLAGGFAEAGPDGVRRLQALRAAATGGGVRVLGPGAIGLVDTRSGLTLTANAAFADGGLPPGSTFVASQSGSLIGALASRGKARGIGFAALVSVGSECDLTLGEICAATLEDPGITGYALFLETLAHAEDLRAFAVAAAARGRPVVAYKLGRSPAGAELALTHTGTLAGDDDVAAAFLADCGVARVTTFEALFESVPLAARTPPRQGPSAPRVGVLTATGGGAALVVDELARRGLAVTAPSAATLQRLADAVGFEVATARIVDLTLRGTGERPMKAALEVLRSSGEFDALVQVIGSSAASDPGAAVGPLVDRSPGGPPLAVFAVPEAPEALRLLGSAGVAAFRTPESCADALAALLMRRPPRHVPQLPAPSTSVGRVLGESEAGALLDRLGVPRVASVTVDDGAPVPPLPSFPVAVKAVVGGLAHKSDVGGVVLDVVDGDGVKEAMASIKEDAARRRPGTEIARFLVQPMVVGVAEVLVGFRRDLQVGPVIVVAPGGTLAELGTERSIRMAPVDAATARSMIAEVPGLARLLAGYRGRRAGDVDALADAIAALSRLALEPDVLEAEVNPLIVTADGVVAADALARVS